MREALPVAGLGGLVLFLFGLVSYAATGTFDLWTAIHVAGGGILIAVAALANLAGVRRTVASRGTRERLQAVAGAFLFVGLLVALNVAATRHPWRWDATEQKIHTVSEKTRALVASVDRPVEIVAFMPAGDRSIGATEEILGRFAALSSRITWRRVDPEQDPVLAEQLGVRRQGVLVARSDAGSAQVEADEAGVFSEAAIARVIGKAARPSSRVVYVLAGHGEPRQDDLETPQGLGALAKALADENVRVAPLVLSTAPDVPADATVVLVAAPTKPLIDHEIERLRTYLVRGGRLLALLDPESDTSLTGLLADYRIRAADTMVVDLEDIPFLGARLGLDPILSDFPPHAITKGFHERVLVSQARSIEPAGEGGLEGTQALVLAQTGPQAWAEDGWRALLASGRVAPPPEGDRGPVPVAVAATGPNGARVVAIGDSDLARNGRIGHYFNREFLVSTLQWLAGDEDLIAEPARTLRASRLDMTEADYRTLFRLGVLLLPEGLLIVGLAFWWRRRSL